MLCERMAMMVGAIGGGWGCGIRMWVVGEVG